MREFWKEYSLIDLSEEHDGQMYFEEWEPIKGYEGMYEISSFGRIKSLEKDVIINGGGIRKQPTIIMKQQMDRKGYCYITLPILKKNNSKDRSKKYKIHRLVGFSFIKRKKGQNEINHRFGVKHDNRYHQLEWSTHQENVIDSYSKGMKIGVRGERSHYAKLKEDDILMIRKLKNEGVSVKEIASRYATSVSYIYDICKRKTWKHI
jgi:hypothetical protein